MARLATIRGSFNPEALRQIAFMVDDVWEELAEEGLYDASMSLTAARSHVARKVFQIARARWTSTQIRQLLVRALRNEVSSRKRELPPTA